MPRPVGGGGGSAAVVSNNARCTERAQDLQKQRREDAKLRAATRREKMLRKEQQLRAHMQTYFWGRVSLRCRQMEVRNAYLKPAVQWTIAGLILGNFITNVIEKQIDPWNENYPDAWFPIETVWNSIFIFELLWNMYGSFYVTTCKGHFFTSSWNIFDFIVVSVSVPSMTGQDLGSFSQLRMLRAFRVFRLFKRIKSLNKILNSISHAIPGIINAAAVMFLVMCIFAILGVDFFGQWGIDNEGNPAWVNVLNETIELRTTRGMSYGEEYYGNFGRSLYTLFQVLTGESWSEVVARPAIFSKDIAMRSTIFYVMYILICGIVLVNVAVAVLLEKMVDRDEPEEDDESDGLSESFAIGQENARPRSPALESLDAAKESRDMVASLRDELAEERALAAQREERMMAVLVSLQSKVNSLEAAAASSAAAATAATAAASMMTDTPHARHRARRAKQRLAGGSTGDVANPNGSMAPHSAVVDHTGSQLTGSHSMHRRKRTHSSTPEDVRQDGERQPSKQTPGRVFGDAFDA